jgi:selenocysteine lyase/cysteine desulfurase
MLAAMAAVPAPTLREADDGSARAVRMAMRDEDGVEVALADWPVRAARPPGTRPTWLVRASAQAYVTADDVERLVGAVSRRLA